MDYYTIDHSRQKIPKMYLCILFKQKPRIPTFGDWENSVDVTQKFEGARKGKKTGVYANPNEPGRNPEPPRQSPLNPSAYTPDPREQAPRTPLHGRRPANDPHQREAVPRRHTNPQREQRGDANTPKSPYRNASGSASPMQSKPRAAGMRTPERRTSSDAHGQHTPSRSRMRQSNQGYNVVHSNPWLLIGSEYTSVRICACGVMDCCFCISESSLTMKWLFRHLVNGMRVTQNPAKSLRVSSTG